MSSEHHGENPSHPPLIWALLDDRAGNRSQCLGVADALGLAYTVKEVRYSLFAGLPNGFLGASLIGLSPDSRLEFQPPWPDVVIAAGRRAAPVARAIRKLSANRCTKIFRNQPLDFNRGLKTLIRPGQVAS